MLYGVKTMWTQSDLQYWAARKAPKTVLLEVEGRKVGKIFAQPTSPHINSVINQHDENREKTNCTLHNTLVILKGCRRCKESVRSKLAEMINNPGCSEPKKRAAYCLKWLTRIERNSNL